MKSMTRLVKRLLTTDTPSTCQSAAPALEPMEGRLLMSATLASDTLTTESPVAMMESIAINFAKMDRGPDGQPIR